MPSETKEQTVCFDIQEAQALLELLHVANCARGLEVIDKVQYLKNKIRDAFKEVEQPNLGTPGSLTESQKSG